MYWVYILRCSNRTLYTGIAKDVNRRLDEHNSSVRGAKYTRARRPVRLVYARKYRSRSNAQKREAQIKRLTRTEKLALIRTAASTRKPKLP